MNVPVLFALLAVMSLTPPSATAAGVVEAAACHVQDGVTGCPDDGLARAQALLDTGYPLQALDAAVQAESAARATCADCARRGRALLLQAQAFSQLERDRAATDKAAAALALLDKAAPGSTWLANALALHARLALFGAGREASAVEIDRAVELFDAAGARNTPAFAEALKVRGIVRDAHDDLAGMRADWKESLALFQRTAPGGTGEIGMLILHALLAYNLDGDLQAARGLLERAATLNARFGQLNRLSANLAYHRGEVERLSGHYEAAAREIRQSLDISAALGAEPRELAAVGGVLAMVHLAAGDASAADAAIAEAVERFKGDPRYDDDAAAAALYVGWAKLGLGRAAQARSEFERAYRRWSRPGQEDSGEASKASLGIARAALAMGDAAAAIDYLQRAHATYASLAPDSLTMAEIEFGLGDARASLGQNGLAERHFCAAAHQLEGARLKVGDPLQEARFRGQHAEAFYRCMQLQLASHDTDAALRTLERARALRARSDFETAGLDGSRFFPAELWQRMGGASAESNVPTESRDAALRKARSEAPGAAALLFPDIPQAGALKARVPEGITVVLYAVEAHQTTVFVVDRHRVRTHLVPIEADVLGQRIERFSAAIRSGATGAAVRSSATALFELLLAQALRDVPADERLLISPDGALYALPFAALWDAGEKRYLIESHPLQLIESLADLEPSEARAAPELPLLAIADPAQPGKAPSDFGVGPLPALPRAREEAAWVARTVPGDERLLQGTDATEAKVAAAMTHAGVIHFATHALVLDDAPMESAILLSSSGPPADASSNGLLQVREIFEGPPLEADLVTLAACESGRGKTFTGAGMVGFPRAFRFAGVRNVLATLWAVGDASSLALMARFYTERANGRDDGRALQAAIVEQIHRGTRGLANDVVRGVSGLQARGEADDVPWRWAGYVLFAPPPAPAQPSAR